MSKGRYVRGVTNTCLFRKHHESKRTKERLVRMSGLHLVVASIHTGSDCPIVVCAMSMKDLRRVGNVYDCASDRPYNKYAGLSACYLQKLLKPKGFVDANTAYESWSVTIEAKAQKVVADVVISPRKSPISMILCHLCKACRG